MPWRISTNCEAHAANVLTAASRSAASAPCRSPAKQRRTSSLKNPFSNVLSRPHTATHGNMEMNGIPALCKLKAVPVLRDPETTAEHNLEPCYRPGDEDVIHEFGEPQQVRSHTARDVLGRLAPLRPYTGQYRKPCQRLARVPRLPDRRETAAARGASAERQEDGTQLPPIPLCHGACATCEGVPAFVRHHPPHLRPDLTTPDPPVHKAAADSLHPRHDLAGKRFRVVLRFNCCCVGGGGAAAPAVALPSPAAARLRSIAVRMSAASRGTTSCRSTSRSCVGGSAGRSTAPSTFNSNRTNLAFQAPVCLVAIVLTLSQRSAAVVVRQLPRFQLGASGMPLISSPACTAASHCIQIYHRCMSNLGGPGLPLLLGRCPARHCELVSSKSSSAAEGVRTGRESRPRRTHGANAPRTSTRSSTRSSLMLSPAVSCSTVHVTRKNASLDPPSPPTQSAAAHRGAGGTLRIQRRSKSCRSLRAMCVRCRAAPAQAPDPRSSPHSLSICSRSSCSRQHPRSRLPAADPGAHHYHHVAMRRGMRAQHAGELVLGSCSEVVSPSTGACTDYSHARVSFLFSVCTTQDRTPPRCESAEVRAHRRRARKPTSSPAAASRAHTRGVCTPTCKSATADSPCEGCRRDGG